MGPYDTPTLSMHNSKGFRPNVYIHVTIIQDLYIILDCLSLLSLPYTFSLPTLTLPPNPTSPGTAPSHPSSPGRSPVVSSASPGSSAPSSGCTNGTGARAAPRPPASARTASSSTRRRLRTRSSFPRTRPSSRARCAPGRRSSSRMRRRRM